MKRKNSKCYIRRDKRSLKFNKRIQKLCEKDEKSQKLKPILNNETFKKNKRMIFTQTDILDEYHLHVRICVCVSVKQNDASLSLRANDASLCPCAFGFFNRFERTTNETKEKILFSIFFQLIYR